MPRLIRPMMASMHGELPHDDGRYGWEFKWDGRLVRLSGALYTIVRPGWLDNGPSGDHVTIEQGDTTDASISREVLSTVLVEALLSDQAAGKTFEAFSVPGPATRDWNGLFARADRDQPRALDAVKDAANMPLDAEPSTVKSDLIAVRTTP